MATIQQALPRSSGSRLPAVVHRVSLSDIKTGGSGLPNRHLLHAVEGWGKTSLGAKAPKPIFIQSRGETGLETLVQAGMLPETPRFPECNSWREINDAVDVLIEEDHPYRTLVLDTINGAERLCHEMVCTRDFGGDWGDKGFASYQKGPEVAMSDWLLLLQKLDKLRSSRKMTIFLLAHTKVSTFKNPAAADYDRYQADLNKWTLSATAKWADAIFFGEFEVVVDTKRKNDTKGKGVMKRRVLHTEHSAAFDAKNRLGLPAEIDMGASPDEAWANLAGALKDAKTRKLAEAAGQPQPTETQPTAVIEEEPVNG